MTHMTFSIPTAHRTALRREAYSLYGDESRYTDLIRDMIRSYLVARGQIEGAT